MSKRSVLILDDDDEFRDSLKDILESYGYNITSSGTISAAIELAVEYMPQVALIDIKLPDGSGTLFLEKLKEINKDCICVMMTAFADLKTALSALEHGAFQYLQKPVHPEELLNLLKRVYDIISLKQEKLKAEEALKHSESTLRSLLNAYPSAAMLLDLEGRIIAANSRVGDVLRRKSDELIGMDASLISSKEVAENRARKAFEAVTQGKSVRFEEHDNGKILDSVFNPVKNGKGEVTSLAVFSRDVTRLKQEAEEKRKLEATLAHTQRMEAIGTLAGGIAHDFNNLLQGILGYIELLLIDKKENDPDHSMLSEMKHSANRASELTKQLLTFSRKVDNELSPLSLNKVIRQVEGLLKRTIPKMINMVFVLDENLKIIEGDSTQMEQVIMNLALNARDAMPEGGTLTFTTKNVILDEAYCKNAGDCIPGDYVMLSVCDTGKGIDGEVVEHIFEPFFTTKEIGKGTGLGLAMVFGIVKNHGGSIVCESNPDTGVSFNVYFPVFDGLTADDAEVEIEDDFFLYGSETILIVEDEAILRDFTSQLLTRFGYRTLLAESGEEALALYEGHKNDISLILLDLIMPGIGGKHCMEELLRQDPGLKVLIASGYSGEDSEDIIMKGGAKGFIAKPYNMRNLLKRIREILGSD
ncbi:MAG: response regulator [Spirochaetes bacterium]|nr:response regulator [Spirochaetota bacterium]